jgi:hypothetical protein
MGGMFPKKKKHLGQRFFFKLDAARPLTGQVRPGAEAKARQLIIRFTRLMFI